MNELKVGLVNTDIIKDLCSSMYPKNMEPPKIDLSLKALLEQRSFYPLFPGNADVPIEYDQIEKLYITEQPDLLITSSDLIQFVKTIEGVVCINPGAIFKNDQAGTYCTLTIEPFDYKAYVSTHSTHQIEWRPQQCPEEGPQNQREGQSRHYQHLKSQSVIHSVSLRN